MAKILVLLISLPTARATGGLPNPAKSIPPGWHQMGTGTKNDHQQGIAAGHFTYSLGPELVTTFSHSNIGVFHHAKAGGQWNMSVLHGRFEPASYFENFEQENIEKRGWQVSGWQRDAEPNCPSIDYASMFFDSNDGICGETLISPPIDLTAQSMPMLKVFWWNTTGGDYI